MTTPTLGSSVALIDKVRDRLVGQQQLPTASTVAAAVRAEGGLIGDASVLALSEQLSAELVGFGVLQDVVDEPGVTDVLVNAPNEVWIDRGVGLERTAIQFDDEAAVRSLARRLASAAGRRLDAASPCVDVRVGHGIRLHAVLPPLSPRGTLISIRVPRRSTLTLDDLARSGGLGRNCEQWLRAVIEARLAFVVTGGTGTGKTTLLGSLLTLVPDRERIVLVEDSGELRPAHPHVVRLEARAANVEGSGEVSMRDLVRQALRMRPDRLVVGEARGAEIVDLLAAMNTGHEGGCGTLHANAPEHVPARIEALAAVGGLGKLAADAQMIAAIDAVIHVVRGRDGRRRVAALGVLEVTGADVTVCTAVRWDADGACDAGPGLEGLRRKLKERL